MKKLAVVLALAMVLAELPGCSFTGLSAQNLMSPPKANADQQSIYRLLQGGQTNVTFAYPKNGEFRSAIIMRDFTGDGVEDAVGFHTMEDDSVEVQFLTKSEGEWTTAAAFRNTATQVDRVCFSALPGGGEAVLIGWGSTAGTTARLATVNAYLYQENGGVNEHALGGYGDMVLTDFDGDGVNELFTIDKSVLAEAEGEETVPARARLYVFDQDVPRELTGVDADNNISNYSSVVFGQLNSEACGVVVDGTTADGSMTTQAFFLQGQRMESFPPEVNTESYTKEYTRPATASFTARDINGDGYIELPAATRLPGLSEDSPLDSTSYMVEWRALSREGGSRTILRALMNIRENYWFRLPYILQGKVCAINDVDRRTVTYTEITTSEDGDERFSGTLFSVRVFTRSAWESRGTSSGYQKLAEQNDSVYGIQITARDEQYRRAVQEIAKNFQLLTE